jgi:ADP-ribose pyrophosphatase
VSVDPGGGFRLLGEHDLHTWRSFALVEAEFAAPGGLRFTRTFLRHPGAVAVVAIDGDDVILVRQFRAALGRTLLEIPAGTLDRPDEAPRACAERELAEEIGARADRVEPLASYAVAPGVSSEWLHLFVATGLTFGERAADGIEEQAMSVERIPLSDAVTACVDGRIQDAKTIVGLLLATRR